MGDKGERAGGGDGRVFLAQRAGRGIARVGEFAAGADDAVGFAHRCGIPNLFRGRALAFGCFAALALLGVELREIGEREENFPAYFHDLRNIAAAQALRNGGDGGDIAGDIFPGHAVPAGGGHGERAVVIAQVDREAVDFCFRGDGGA